jgi:DNA-binding transcriptional MerR regulator
MESSSGRDLFEGFNEVEASEVLRGCTNCGRFVIIGPPRSGKTFFREKYLEGVTVVELTLGVTTTARTEGEEAEGESGLQKVMGLLKRMIPIIGKFRDKERVKDEELRRVLGDWAPKHVVEWAKKVIGDSPHRAYYIRWECVEKPNECASDQDASKALGLIKEVFDDRKVRIRWFNADYVPPGLVEEVIELVREKGEDEARKVLKGWVDAYFKAVGTLTNVLGLKENILEWDESSIRLLSDFVNNIANYVIGVLAATSPMGAASQLLISVLTYMASKKERENILKEIIELWESLKKLRVEGSDDFYELGRLLVYRVAYAMGMSYDEAKEALMGITGLSMDELKKRVDEIERKIKELEKKIKELEERLKSFRQERRAGIETADVEEFAKGGIYPNVRVENGELRVRVEGGYHSIVRAGKFNELINEVRNRLLNQDLVVVVGPKGIGKSTLASAEIWELFLNGDIGLVARVDALDSENYSEFTTFVENYGREFGKYFGKLLILYDPVSTKAYESADIDVKADIQANIEGTIEVLMKAIESIGSEASKPLALIVIPSDVYNALSEEMRNALEGYRLDVSQELIDTEFLAELIREYTRTKSNPNGCALSDRELSELAGELAKFDSGHALIARLIGEELARSNCSAREIEELISKAKGKAEAFIILQINGLFKVHKKPKTAKALVEIFALRRPFINSARPGDPILTPGIIELIGEKKGASLLQSAESEELRGWLALRQHDLIEEAIKKLLICVLNRSKECEELGGALEPWRLRTVRRSLREVSEKVRDVSTAVEYFVGNYGKDFTDALRDFSNECWKRAAFIIGRALTGIPIVPRPEDFPEDLRKSAVESLCDALREHDVDYYLLVGNEIPPLIWYLIDNHAHVLAEAFIDKYNEAVSEVNRILNIARGKGRIYDVEEFYGLGLASIIANAPRLNRDVESSDADIALHIAAFAIQHVVSPDLIESVLDALEPLRDKTLHRYLELLALASNMENLDPIAVNYIFGELNEILDNHGGEVKERTWSLVHAIDAYANLLWLHHCYFDNDEVKGAVGRIADLLNELGKFKSNLGVIAWAHALAPALEHEYVRGLMEKKLGIDVVGKASEVLEELNDMRERVQELMRDKEFMSYVESKFVKADEEAVNEEILGAASLLKHVLTIYRLDNDELDEAEELFNELAEERREIGDYQNDLVNRSWVLRIETIRGSLVGEKLVNEFRRLYEETFKEEHFKLTATYLSIASGTLGEYLVSLALTGNYEMINEIPEEHLWVLNADKEVSVPTMLMLNVLLGSRGRLSGELEGKLSVNTEELINAFGYDMLREYLPALGVALGMISPEEGYEECKSIEDSTERRDCEGAVSAVMNDSDAVRRLREKLIKYFRKQKRILENDRSGWFRELGFDTNAKISEFEKLVDGLNGKSLVQLIAPGSLSAMFALMLHALINGNKELAKALALYGAYGAVKIAKKLPARLFLEAYNKCCDLDKDEFRLAIARLFFLHV